MSWKLRMLRMDVEERTIFRVVHQLRCAETWTTAKAMPLRMIIPTSKLQALTLAATHLPRAAIDGMDELRLIIWGILGTARALAGMVLKFGAWVWFQNRIER